MSFDIEFLNGSKADDTYFLVVWYPDKSYDKWALNRVEDPRGAGAAWRGIDPPRGDQGPHHPRAGAADR